MAPVSLLKHSPPPSGNAMATIVGLKLAVTSSWPTPLVTSWSNVGCCRVRNVEPLTSASFAQRASPMLISSAFKIGNCVLAKSKW